MQIVLEPTFDPKRGLAALKGLSASAQLTVCPESPLWRHTACLHSRVMPGRFTSMCLVASRSTRNTDTVIIESPGTSSFLSCLHLTIALLPVQVMNGVECSLNRLASGRRPWGEAAGSGALPHIIRRIDQGKEMVLLFSVDIKASDDRWGIGWAGGWGWGS